LSEIPDNSVDCCIESPMYYQQRVYPDGVRDTSKRQLGLERSVDEYVHNQADIHDGLYKKIKDTGSLFIVIADSFDKGEDCLVIEKLATEMQKRGWHCIQKWIWPSENSKPQSKIKRLMPNYQMVIHFVKDIDKYNWREFKNWKEGGFKAARGTKDIGMGKKRNITSWTLAKPVERFRSFLDRQHVKNVLQANGFNWNELKEIDPNYRHDAPFSMVIPLLPILMTTKVGDSVLDIYNGCGSSTAAARYLRRKAIGYDTDDKAHKFAAKRLRMTEVNLPTEDEIRGLEDDYMEAA
jgi:DNA modification methylase